MQYSEDGQMAKEVNVYNCQNKGYRLCHGSLGRFHTGTQCRSCMENMGHRYPCGTTLLPSDTGQGWG